MCIRNFVATDIVVSTVALELHNSDMPMYLSISKMAFRAKIHFGISLHMGPRFFRSVCSLPRRAEPYGGH